MDSPDALTSRLRPASLLPFIAWAVVLFLQLISPARVWSWLLVGLGTLLVVSYWWARNLRDHVSVTRQVTGTWVVAGDQLRELFTLTNQGRVPVLWAQVVDHSAVPGYSANRVESVGTNAQRKWTFSGTCERRGVFRLGPWDLRMADPFGFFEVTQHYPAITNIMVYPRASYLPELDLPRGRASGRAATSLRSPAETINIGGLRDFLPGDSLRRVHWRSSARHDRLMVREFEREPSGDLWLIVDMDAAVQAGHAAEATQEYAVVLAASLAAQLAREGERRAVGLVVSGAHPALLSPGRGQAQVWRILRALAEAEPGAGRALAPVLDDLKRSLGSGVTLVVLTPSQEPAWVGSLLGLMERGNAPAVLLLDGTTFDPPCGTVEGLAGIRSLLVSQRIPNYVMAKGFPFRPVERIRRSRRELKTLPGTGRVIEVSVEEEI
jgi:uncharacterized protein (DUF58 family)